MHNITLVCSAHRENGLCNVVELLKIFQTIEPEVVFEESRPSDRDSIWTLEAQALTKYRESKVFQRIPVDRYDLPGHLIAETFAESQRVFDCVEQTSHEYRVLNEEHDNRVHQYGFAYLNSVACSTMMARISDIEEQTIIGTGDQGLIRALERWRFLIESRERAMIGNIYEYCRDNAFDTGVFLVGAAHKGGIVKEIRKYASLEAVLISWTFLCDGHIP